MRVRVTAAIVAVGLALLLLGAACAADTNPSGTVALNDRGLGLGSNALASLENCGSGTVCGQVSDVDGHPIRFRILPSTSPKPVAGVIVVHFGGPGSDALQILPDWVTSASSTTASSTNSRDNLVLERFDLLAVEQRGHDTVDGVDCGNDEIFHQIRTVSAPLADLERLAREWISGCPVGEFGSTTAAADIATVLDHFDSPRAVFVGYSYGSVIGVLLGTDHSESVDAIVLDSPAFGWLEPRSDLQQVRTFNNALTEFFDNCDRTRACRFAPSGNSEQRFGSLVDSYELPGDLLYATVFLLYGESTAPLLDLALTLALDGDDSFVTEVADTYNRRTGDDYEPPSQVFQLVACADGLESFTDDPDEYRAELRKFGVLGEMAAETLVFTDDICDHWAGRVNPFSLDMSRSDVPVLLAASLNDPATPWIHIQAALDSGQLPPQVALVVVDGFNHSLWLSGNGCVDAAVNAFVLNGAVPSGGRLDCSPAS